MDMGPCPKVHSLQLRKEYPFVLHSCVLPHYKLSDDCCSASLPAMRRPADGNLLLFRGREICVAAVCLSVENYNCGDGWLYDKLKVMTFRPSFSLVLLL